MFSLITWCGAVNLDKGCLAGAGKLGLPIRSLFAEPSAGKLQAVGVGGLRLVFNYILFFRDTRRCISDTGKRPHLRKSGGGGGEKGEGGGSEKIERQESLVSTGVKVAKHCYSRRGLLIVPCHSAWSQTG